MAAHAPSDIASLTVHRIRFRSASQMIDQTDEIAAPLGMQAYHVHSKSFINALITFYNGYLR